MRVALVGANGQLGVDIQQTQKLEWPDISLYPLSRSECDVTDSEQVNSCLEELRIDAVVNCSSYHLTDEVEDNAALAMAVNAHGVQTLAVAANTIGARLIHISTDYVFGGESHTNRIPESATDRKSAA